MSAEMQCAMFFVWKSSYHCRWMGHIVVYKSLVKTLRCLRVHYNDVMMSAMASHIICVSSVCSTVCSGADQGKHQSRSTSLAFVREIHWWPVDSPHKGPVSREIFPFDDVVMRFMLFFSHCRMFCISYHIILDHVLTRLNCNSDQYDHSMGYFAGERRNGVVGPLLHHVWQIFHCPPNERHC